MNRTAGSSSGPTAQANLLAVLVLITSERAQIVIHAMSIRPGFRRLTEP